MSEVEAECGEISASQEDILARSSFLGGGGDEEQEGQGEQEEDAVTMCTQPSPSSREEEGHQAVSTKEKPPKPRICTRKVRGAKDVDPLYKAVLMIPSAPAPTSTGDLLALARQRGIF